MVSCEHGGSAIPQEWEYLFEGIINAENPPRLCEYGAQWLYESIAPAIADYSDISPISPLVVDMDGSIGNGTALSAITCELPAHDAGKIIRDYYLPYQIEFEDRAEGWAQDGEPVLMIGLHTFEPVVNNIPLGMDIGLIFDHNDTEERSLALRIKRGFEKNASWLTVRFNAPHKVKEDGFVQHMREMYGQMGLKGIEIEVGENVIFPEGIRAIKNIVTEVIGKWKDEYCSKRLNN